MGGPSITCCMIVRDEAHNLADCFAAAAPLVDEWIVVDTGSTDGTPELAERLGATVLHVPWRDDFSFVRNASLERAGGEWTVVLDADDRLRDGQRLREVLLRDPEVDALQLEVTSVVGRADGSTWLERSWQPRVLRRSAGIRYQYAIHEVPVLDGLRVGVGPGRIEHLGYQDHGRLLDKARRVLAMAPSLPDDEPHRWLHTARASSLLDDHATADAASRRLGELVEVMPPDARLLWAQSLAKLARPQEAAEVLQAGLRDHPDHPGLYYGLFLAGGYGFLATAAPLLREGGWFSGTMACLDHLPQVVSALVEQQALDPAILDSPLLEGLIPPAAPCTQDGAR